MPREIGHSSTIVSRVSKADQADKIYRLTDMEVEEVSMVDRAANKRKFLVVKRDGDPMSTQVQPDGKGGFTSAGSATKAGYAAGDEDPKKKKPGAAMKASAEVPPGFKE